MWGRGARLRLDALACGPVYRKASISEARSASASGRSPGGAGETLAGGFPQAAPGGRPTAAGACLRPCSTVRFAKTCNRKPGELSLPGFCFTRRALCVAQLPPDALFLGSPFKGSCRRSRLRGGGTLRILPKEYKFIPPLRPRLRASASPSQRGRLWVSVNSAAQAKPGRAVIRSLSVSSLGSRNIW